VKKEVIVFGGSGFLGSHVADVLSERGHNVTIFDVKESPYLRPDQKLIKGDIGDYGQVLEAMKGKEVVYHFAGLADLDNAKTQPLETVSQNVMGTVHLLDAAKEEGVERFIFASTIYVYSALGGFYRCSKQAGELYIEEYQKRYGLDFTILRYGTLYGPRADTRNSICRFLRSGLNSGKISFSGSEEETREYINVRDASKLSVDILSEEYKNGYIIITGHYPMKAKEVFKMITEILGDKVFVEYQNNKNETHYEMTPYSFTPKIGNKLVSNCYVDMGQGLLECLYEISQEDNGSGNSDQG
jgi:UDP-glucose 4-epimerase